MAGKHQPDVHLNLNIRGMPASATLRINARCRELKKQGVRVFNLGLGQSPFPVPDPVIEALKVNAFQKDYLPVEGLHELRVAVAAYLNRTQRLARTAEDVLVGPGSKELMFILQLVYYGDLVIPMPSWVSYAPQAQIAGRQVRWVPTSRESRWHITPDELQKICADDPQRPRIVVLNYPANPTGATYKLDDLKQLARVAREHRVILLSDEIYGELHHKGQHVSVARFYPEGTIVSGGLSKWCGAGGWRLGAFAFPAQLNWLREAMAAVASETYTSVSAPIQYAAVRAYRGGITIERYLWNSRRILRALGRHSARLLERAGAFVSAPQGAFYLFPDFTDLTDALCERGVSTSGELCERLLDEAGVACLPGSAFGRPEPELTVRLSYVDFDGARALAAAEMHPPERKLDIEFLRTYCPKVVDGVERISAWLSG